MGKGKKFQEVMTTDQVAQFLRTLANQLEGKPDESGEPLIESLGNLRKFSVSFKRDSESEQISVKMKSKYFSLPKEEKVEVAAAEPATEAKPEYKNVKKAMKESFKEIFKSLANGTFPSEQVVESFMENAKLMVTYTGKGDEHYQEFTTVCARFREAFQKRDLAECQAKANVLNRMKTECHSDHK